MDQQSHHGRSPSASAGRQTHLHQSQPDQQLDINQSSHHSPSPGAFGTDPSSVGLGLQQQHHSLADAGVSDTSFDSLGGPADFLAPSQQSQAFAQSNVSDPALFDPGAPFGQQQSGAGPDPGVLSFDSQSQSQSTAAYLSPNINDGDFSLFPPSGGQGDHFNAPLFEQPTLSPNDLNTMTSPQPPHSPTPPNLLQPDSHHPGSAQHSPSFSQTQFSSPPGGHSRNVSLGPESALLPGQIADWSQPQFQGHRRTPSEYSEVSSVSPSPNLVSSDSFDDHGGHSPLQRASDGSLYQEVLNIGAFSIADTRGRSPSHSPAISPRINPQQLPDMNQTGFGLAPPSANYGAYPGLSHGGDSFPSLQQGGDMSQMAPPAINIDFAPNNSKPGLFEQPKPHMDQDSLTPPERGMFAHS